MIDFSKEDKGSGVEGNLLFTVYSFVVFEFCNEVHILLFQLKNTFFWASYYLELRSIYILFQELDFGGWKLISSLASIMSMLLTFHQSSNFGFEGG